MGSELARRLVAEYPEMGWLAGPVQASAEAQGQLAEFQRTYVGVKLLHDVVTGDYESFTAGQPAEVRLSRESFAKLRQWTAPAIGDGEYLRALETFVVINDLGKVDAFAARVDPAELDHDQVLLDGLRRDPGSSPSFRRLPEAYRRMIVDGLATGLNPAQVIQLEAPAVALRQVGGVDRETLRFYLLHTVYDVAGAAGHIRQDGSVVMTEPVFRTFDAFLDELERFDPVSYPAEAVYAAYLRRRAEWLGLDVDAPEQAAMTRIGGMLRHTTPEQGRTLMEAYRGLPPQTQRQLVAGLNRTGIGGGRATLIYYGPALLAKLLKSRPDGLREGLAVFARIYELTTGPEQDGVFVAMAGPLADAATGAGALTRLKLEPTSGGARVTFG